LLLVCCSLLTSSTLLACLSIDGQLCFTFIGLKVSNVFPAPPASVTFRGFELDWSDEFDGAILNPKMWVAYTGNGGQDGGNANGVSVCAPSRRCKLQLERNTSFLDSSPSAVQQRAGAFAVIDHLQV
jgi:hypothetical protein